VREDHSKNGKQTSPTVELVADAMRRLPTAARDSLRDVTSGVLEKAVL
jgi:hypothetical protein